MYRYISRESCSQFDSLPLTSLTPPPPVASYAHARGVPLPQQAMRSGLQPPPQQPPPQRRPRPAAPHRTGVQPVRPATPRALATGTARRAASVAALISSDSSDDDAPLLRRRR